jgi:hypothetical protein
MVENTWKTRLTKVTVVNCQFSISRADATLPIGSQSAQTHQT